jgi:hypothetical protein
MWCKLTLRLKHGGDVSGSLLNVRSLDLPFTVRPLIHNRLAQVIPDNISSAKRFLNAVVLAKPKEAALRDDSGGSILAATCGKGHTALSSYKFVCDLATSLVSIIVEDV